jgi:hypothetical protein
VALRDDQRRKIDLVIWWPNARAELNHQIPRIRSELPAHLLDGHGRDSELGPFFPGVQQTDRAANGINDIDRAAIGHIDAEANARRGSDEAIGSGHGIQGFLTGANDIVSMDLQACDKLHLPAIDRVASSRVPLIETLQREFAVNRDINPESSLREAVADECDFLERGKSLDRELSVHADRPMF